MVILHFILDTLTEDRQAPLPFNKQQQQPASAAPCERTSYTAEDSKMDQNIQQENNNNQTVQQQCMTNNIQHANIQKTATTTNDDNCLETNLIENDPITKELYDYVYDDQDASKSLSDMYTSLNKSHTDNNAFSELRVDEHWKKMSASEVSNTPLMTTSFEVIGNINDNFDDNIAGFDLSGGWETMYEMI